MGSGRIDPLFRRIEAGDVLIVTQLACSTRDLLNVIAALAERCRLQEPQVGLAYADGQSARTIAISAGSAELWP
jgi:hypothetical protein